MSERMHFFLYFSLPNLIVRYNNQLEIASFFYSVIGIFNVALYNSHYRRKTRFTSAWKFPSICFYFVKRKISNDFWVSKTNIDISCMNLSTMTLERQEQRKSVIIQSQKFKKKFLRLKEKIKMQTQSQPWSTIYDKKSIKPQQKSIWLDFSLFPLIENLLRNNKWLSNKWTTKNYMLNEKTNDVYVVYTLNAFAILHFYDGVLICYVFLLLSLLFVYLLAV